MLKSISYQFKCLIIYNMMICISYSNVHSVLGTFQTHDVFVPDQHCRRRAGIKTTSNCWEVCLIFDYTA